MNTVIINIIGAIGVAGVGLLALVAPEPQVADGPANVAVFERAVSQ